MSYHKNLLDKPLNRAMKRSLDIVVSLVVFILVLIWLIPLVCILIKLTSKGPVFFRQERTGLGNEKFRILKFRTMHVNETSDTHEAVHNDPRITPIGKLLRMSHIDEFPQFLQTLSGTMSIVGPRPHMLLHTSEYTGKIDYFMERHAVKPGITGLAQVNGYRGQIKDLEDMKMRVHSDLWYMKNWSLWLDIKVCFLTCYIMLKEFLKHLFVK